MAAIFELAEPKQVVEWLNGSSFDELVEIDVVNNTCRNIYHVEGKYFVPVFDGSYFDLYRYSVGHMVHPDDLNVYKPFMDPTSIIERLKDSEVPGMLSAQFRYKLQDGNWRWTEQFVIGGRQFGLPDGVIRFYVFDIQNQKDRESGKIVSGRYKAAPHRDEKTRLLWERAFFDEAKKVLERVDPSQWCAVAIDLDHFRLFNDWYGRVQGDLLLANVGECLSAAELRTGGLAGYLGQDDFCMLMPYDTASIERLFADISAEIAEFSSSIGFRPVFGVSVADEHMAFLDLFDRAKVALDHARANFKRDISYFESDMQEQTDMQYQVLLDFKEALSNREFVTYLQPQCRASTGKVVGVEALVRWCKPDGSIVPPGDFIPVLEKYGFITDLDCYVWEDACAHLKAWIEAGHKSIPISVNVSQVDIYTMDVPSFFFNLVRTYDIPPSLVKVEITESAFADSSSSVEVVTNRLREAGFLVMMDDFGSGYSSLNMLSSLNVDVIKLDGAFLRLEDEASRRKGMRIVESVVNMAKTMTLPIIAEGVETAEQVEFLEGLGVRYIQGFHFYRPMPIEEFEAIALAEANIDDKGFSVKLNEQMRIREFLDQNVYSDSMLNNILGPVAFYLWHGDDIDIVRYNEQFYEAVDVPDFSEKIVAIQNVVPERYLARFYALFERAMADDLNGSQDVLPFGKYDGTYSWFWLHAYFLAETLEGKRFYVSARDVTDSVALQRQMKVLSESLSSTVMFVYRQGVSWHYEVVVHGLQGLLGVTGSELEHEFEEGRFVERLDPADRIAVSEKTTRAVERGEAFSYAFTMSNASGERVSMQMKADFARNAETFDEVFVVTLSEML